MSETRSNRPTRRGELWARFRFSLIGPLLAAPPRLGELNSELKRLAHKLWRHPITSEDRRFAFSTIQRWYYQARSARADPVAELKRKTRSDAGLHHSLSPPLRRQVRSQYKEHSSWSYQLHYENLRAWAESQPTGAKGSFEVGEVPSYATVRRYMKAHGLLKQRRLRARSIGSLESHDAHESSGYEQREVRSFEVEHVNGLWHLDFHHSSLSVLSPRGEWLKPRLLAVLDDLSRLVCHLQWYLTETTADLVHGLKQAFLKCGLPRSLMTDNGPAMTAGEVREGLFRLGVHHATTLPRSPYQNGKQEVFFAQVEGRLMAMLEGHTELSLDLLNEATLAWVEGDYHRRTHREISVAPLERYLNAPSVARPSPDSEQLRVAFTVEDTRRVRRSDKTFTLHGVRFELPLRFAHLERVFLRYASWDLSHVLLADELEGTVLCPVYPLDKAKNADSRRRPIHVPATDLDPTSEPEHPSEHGGEHDGIAPLLERLLSDARSTGLPPAYLPVPTEEPEPAADPQDQPEDMEGDS